MVLFDLAVLACLVRPNLALPQETEIQDGPYLSFLTSILTHHALGLRYIVVAINLMKKGLRVTLTASCPTSNLVFILQL